MKQQSFEKYLEENVWEPEGVLDDDMPDAFEDWLTGLDVAEVMEHAENWGAKEYEKGCYNTANEANSLANKPN